MNIQEKLEFIIRTNREQQNITQKEMAKKLNKSASTYNEIEKNLHKSNLSTINSICDKLNLQIQIIPKESNL